MSPRRRPWLLAVALAVAGCPQLGGRPDAGRGADGAVDSGAAAPAPDAGEPADASAGPDAGCTLSCPFGRRLAPDGTPACACRACGADADCAISSTCGAARCSAGGACVCDCGGVQAKTYTCPSGIAVPWCACTALGFQCLEHPEHQCATVCTAGEEARYPCSDGSRVPWCQCVAATCAPECRKSGAQGEGWYDSCDGALLVKGACSECAVACQKIGGPDEGWYETCSGALVRKAACAPHFECDAGAAARCPSASCARGQKALWPCAGGDLAPACACDVPAAACPPVCLEIGTPSEGWFDSCQGTLIRRDLCADCDTACAKAGTIDEGWYTCEMGLVARAKCSTGTWKCDAAPWSKCTAPEPCLPEGALAAAPATCCPGLSDLPAPRLDAASCEAASARACTLCGDGACTPPETPCSCAADCLGASPRALGEPCFADEECAPGLGCLERAPDAWVGVCSRACDPASPDCGAGFACLPIPEHQAPGLCLTACAGPADCSPPFTCGGLPSLSPASAGGCFDWGSCDPVADARCPPDAQCRLDAAGRPTCGPRGNLPVTSQCDGAADACGPGLVCSAISFCAPVCPSDDFCNDRMLGHCVKATVASPYGVCELTQ